MNNININISNFNMNNNNINNFRITAQKIQESMENIDGKINY